MLRKKMFMLFYHVALTIYILSLLLRFRKGWKIDCVRHMNIFLVVYAVFEVILTGAQITELSFWCCANDPVLNTTRLRIFLQYHIYVLTSIWIIYGSTFIYDE